MVDGEEDEEQSCGEEDGGEEGRTAPVNQDFLKCPKCAYAVQADCKAFDCENLSAKTWCKQCARSQAVGSWQCACAVRWHLCERHRQAPSKMRGATARAKEQKAEKDSRLGRKPATKRRRRQKAASETSSDEEALTSDRRRKPQKRSAVKNTAGEETLVKFTKAELKRVRPFSPSFLSTKLQRRLKHLVGFS